MPLNFVEWHSRPSQLLLDGLCGGELVATALWQHLTYKGKKKCYWRIKADSSARIRFILDSVSYKCDTTCHSYVEIKVQVTVIY